MATRIQDTGMTLILVRDTGRICGAGRVHTDVTIPIGDFIMNNIFSWRIGVFLFSLLIMTGCASSPKFDNEKYNQVMTPEQVSLDPESYMDNSVLWGGMLIATTNLEQGTQLEVLAYPLQSNQRPDIDRNPIGRFLIVSPDFLEPIDYAQGRTITVIGDLDEVRTGQVGATEYQYPVVNVEQIHLWSKFEGLGAPQVHFGVGLFYGS